MYYKVKETKNGEYYCAKTDKKYAKYDCLRYVLNFQIQDWNRNIDNVVAYHEVSEQILQIKPEKLSEYKKKNQKKFEEIINKALFKRFYFSLEAKQDNYHKTGAEYIAKKVKKVDDFDEEMEQVKKKMIKIKLTQKNKLSNKIEPPPPKRTKFNN